MCFERSSSSIVVKTEELDLQSKVMAYKFCPHCARELKRFLDEDRHRLRCPACGWVHYMNPTVGVAVVLIDKERILLGKRRDGGWCIPCGHVEWDEHVQDAAVREFKEETGLRVRIDEIVAVHSNFHDSEHHTVGIWFRGEKIDGRLTAGGDLEQVGFYSYDQLPDLKFPTDQDVIQQLLSTGKITRMGSE